MIGSKLIDLLSTFNGAEMRLFHEFVQSPYFNKNRSISELVGYLRDLKGRFDEQSLNKTDVFQIVYEGEKYDDLKMRHLMSDTLKLARNFLSYSHYENSGQLKETFLLSELAERKLAKQFNSHYKKLNKEFEKQGLRDSDFYFMKYELEQIRNRSIALQGGRGSDLNFQQESNFLDTFYLINKLRMACEMLSIQNVMAVEHELLLMDEILSYLRSSEQVKSTAISIYYQIYLTLKDPDGDEHFLRLKELLGEHYGKFRPDEARNFYYAALNYCIKRLNTGSKEYLNESFLLYKDALARDLLFENGYLSAWNYKNIVSIGLQLKEFEWVKSFINYYKDFLIESYRDNAYSYNLAKYHFAVENYSEVIKLLQRVEYDDLFYNLDSKSTLIKTYYETQETEALLFLLDSFKMYLTRNKIVSEYHRINYMNMIRYVKKILDIKDPKSDSALKLRNEIKEESRLTNKNWILEKLDSL